MDSADEDIIGEMDNSEKARDNEEALFRKSCLIIYIHVFIIFESPVHEPMNRPENNNSKLGRDIPIYNVRNSMRHQHERI